MRLRRKQKAKFFTPILLSIFCILLVNSVYGATAVEDCQFEKLADRGGDEDQFSPGLRDRLAEGVVDPKLAGHRQAEIGTDAEQAKLETKRDVVQQAKEWIERNGDLDFLLNPQAESPADFPHFASKEELQATYKALKDEKPFSALMLLSKYGNELSDTPMLHMRHLAQKILTEPQPLPKDAFEAYDQKLQQASSLAVLYRSAQRQDLPLLKGNDAWTERFPSTIKLIEDRIKNNQDGVLKEERMTEDEMLAFGRALVEDAVREVPELNVHVDHFVRVAQHVVAMEKARREKEGLDPLTREEEKSLFTSVALHDIGKLFWPRDMVAKTNRISTSDYAQSIIAIDKAGMNGTLSSQKVDEALEALKTLNGKVDPETPLSPVTESQKAIINELADKGIIDREVADLILSPFINLSKDERKMANRHVKGYQALFMMDPDGLPATVAQNHHNMPDGSGYPFKWKPGEDANSTATDLERAKLLGLTTAADVFDAVVGPRPNTPGHKPLAVGVGVLNKQYAGKVDPEAVKLLEELVADKKISMDIEADPFRDPHWEAKRFPKPKSPEQQKRDLAWWRARATEMVGDFFAKTLKKREAPATPTFEKPKFDGHKYDTLKRRYVDEGIARYKAEHGPIPSGKQGKAIRKGILDQAVVRAYGESVIKEEAPVEEVKPLRQRRLDPPERNPLGPTINAMVQSLATLTAPPPTKKERRDRAHAIEGKAFRRAQEVLPEVRKAVEAHPAREVPGGYGQQVVLAERIHRLQEAGLTEAEITALIQQGVLLEGLTD